jgi:hypothetical protein
MNAAVGTLPVKTAAFPAADNPSSVGAPLNNKPVAAAAGNVGMASTRSAVERAMENNWVPPTPEKPSPPSPFELAGNTELVAQINALLKNQTASATDIKAVLDLLSAKVFESSLDGEMQAMKARQDKIEANQKERQKELEVAKVKAELATKTQEWDKFWGMLKSVGSVVLSAAVIAGGVITANPLLVGYGAYMMVNATMDVIDSVRAYQDKEPLGFRLSVGELAGWIAKEAFDADEKTQIMVNLGFEVAFGLAVGGGAAAFGAAKAAKTASDASKLLSAGQTMARVGQVLKGFSDFAQALTRMEMADRKYDMAQSKARLDRLQLIYDMFQKDMERSNELIKMLNEALLGVWDSAAERQKISKETQNRVWGTGRGNMV